MLGSGGVAHRPSEACSPRSLAVLFFFLNDRPPPDISPFPHPAPFPSPPPPPLPAPRSSPPLAADPLQPPCAERLRRGPRAHCCCPPLPSSSSAPSAPGRAGSRPPP